MPIASKSITGAKCEANANGRASAAATSAPNVLDPRIQMGTRRPAPGTACTACPGRGSAKNSITSSTSLGKLLGSTCSVRRKANAAAWSVPGARPRPRSMRPGNSASSVPNCSATCSGGWFGSMMPPARVRMRGGPAPPVADEQGGGRPTAPGNVVMLAQPEPPVAQLLRVLRQLQRVPEGLRRRAALKDRSEIENRQCQSAAPRFLSFFASSIVGPSVPRVCKSLVAEVKNWKARVFVYVLGQVVDLVVG